MTAEPVAPYDPRESFQRFYAENFTRVYRMCVRSFGRDDGEEIAQETMARAFERYDVLDREDDLWPWVVVVARNIGRDLQRSRARLVSAEESDLHELPAEHEPTPVDTVVRRDEARLLALALRRLRPSDVRVLRLREFEELSFAEIADALDISENAVRQHLFRARRHLAREFRRVGGHPAAIVPLVPALLPRLAELLRPTFGRRAVATGAIALPMALAFVLGVVVQDVPGPERRQAPVIRPDGHTQAAPPAAGVGDQAGDDERPRLVAARRPEASVDEQFDPARESNPQVPHHKAPPVPGGPLPGDGGTPSPWQNIVVFQVDARRWLAPREEERPAPGDAPAAPGEAPGDPPAMPDASPTAGLR